MEKFKIQSSCVLNEAPTNVMPGYKNRDEPLPEFTLWGMVNIHGGSVKLRFNSVREYVDIITYNCTVRMLYTEITDFIIKPIEHEENYSSVCFKYGPTETSEYWVFWVPSQYTKAMRRDVLGMWPGF